MESTPFTMDAPQPLQIIPRACLAPVTELLFVHDGTALLAGPVHNTSQRLCTSRTVRGGRSLLLFHHASFSASGASLTIYQLASGRVLEQCCVLEGQRIHGCRSALLAGQRLLLVWGGKQLALLQLHEPQQGHSQAKSTPFFTRVWTAPTRPDLIWDARLLQCNAETCATPATEGGFDIAIGYAHDRVEVLSFSIQSDCVDTSLSVSSRTTGLQIATCEDRSLLYSMCLHGACRHGLLAIGGTVFSHLLVWDASMSALTPAAPGAIDTRSVLHRITGHEGVIFRVEANSDATRLCSVSDDRTVRVWRWQASSGAPSSSPVPLAALLSPSLGSYMPGLEAYGHRARVWRCAMLEEWPIMISSSEDNTCLVWHAHTGQQLARFSGQRGGLWSLCVDTSKRLVATGAGDASIRVWSLDAVLKREGMLAASSVATDSQSASVQAKTLHLHELLPPLAAETAAAASTIPPASPDAHPPTKKAKLAGSAVACSASAATVMAPAKAKKVQAEYCRELLLDADHSHSRMFFVTNFGRIIKVDLSQEGGEQRSTQVTLLHHHTTSPSAIVALALSPCKAFLALGDQRGNLLLLSTKAASAVPPLWYPNAHPSALNFIHWLQPTAAAAVASSSAVAAAAAYQLITADALNEVKVFQLSHTSSAFEVRPRCSFRLPVSKARVTCAVAISTSELHTGATSPPEPTMDEEKEDEDEDEQDNGPVGMSDVNGGRLGPGGMFFICGDNRGSAYVYFLPSAAADSSAPAVALAIDRQLNVHEKAALTSISFASSAAGGAKIFTTATDGRVIEFALAPRHAPHLLTTDAWIEKHNASQAASSAGGLPDAASLAALSEWHLVKMRTHKLSAISAVQQVLFSSSTASRQRDVLVTGFHAADFVVWNLTQNTQVRRWSCGGDKRAWGFQLLPSSSAPSLADHAAPEDGFLFVFARHDDSSKEAASASASGELILHQQLPTLGGASAAAASSTSVPALGCAIHGRLTTNLVAVPLHERACLVITSSEDNTVKLYLVITPDAAVSAEAAHTLPSILSLRSSIQCIATLIDHPDVVRAVAVSQEHATDASLSCLLFSAGGRDFLHCSRVRATPPTAAGDAISVVIESLARVDGHVFKVGGRSWAAREEIARQRMVKQDIRIMCLTAVPVPPQWDTDAAADASSTPPLNAASSRRLHLVVSGNSQGVLKLYLFDGARLEFRPLAECAQHAYPILSVAHLMLGDELLLFSGASDGRIMVWGVKQLVMQAIRDSEKAASLIPLQPTFVHQAHQSGVDCMTVSAASASPSESSFRLFTGGDDESIFALTASVLSRVEAYSSPLLSSVWTHSWPNAHYSAVKSLTLEQDRIYSVSYDQRVRAWTVEQQRSQADGTLSVRLHSAGACLLDVWDLSTIRALPTSSSPSALIGGTPLASPLLVVGGLGLQLLQLAPSS